MLAQDDIHGVLDGWFVLIQRIHGQSLDELDGDVRIEAMLL